MDSILEILYEALEPTMETPKERTALRAARDHLDRSCQGLPEGEIDQLWGVMMDACSESQRTSFLWGFRAGVRLVAEGLMDLTHG